MQCLGSSTSECGRRCEKWKTEPSRGGILMQCWSSLSDDDDMNENEGGRVEEPP